MKQIETQKGQILIILALAMVVLLGFTAVAVDGSKVYNQRRQDQATADSTVLSNAYQIAKSGFTCPASGVPALTATTATSGTTTTATTYPSCTSSGSTITINIHTVVTSTVNTYFLKVISKQPTSTTADAVAKVTIGTGPYVGGNALVVLGTDCTTSDVSTTGGIYTSGAAKITGTGGGIYSNSCISAENSSTPITDTSGTITYVTTVTNPVWMSPTPVKSSTTITAPVIPVNDPPGPPTCSGPSYGAVSVNNSGGTIYPGTYDSISWTSNGVGDLTLSPTNTDGTSGVYCISGSFYADNGAANLIMNGVTLYLSGTGGLTAGGSIATQLDNSFVYITNGNYAPAQRTWAASNSKVYIKKGNYIQGGSVAVTMNKSSVYLSEGNFENGNGSFTAQNFTVIIRKGNFILDNGAYGVNMSAPTCNDSTCGVGPSIQGVLVWMDPAYTHAFTIANGNGAHTLNGTIYAPTAIASMSGGTAADLFQAQLIVQKLSMQNSGTISLNTSGANLYQSGGATSIDLLK
jgi:hypothetical protein